MDDIKRLKPKSRGPTPSIDGLSRPKTNTPHFGDGSIGFNRPSTYPSAPRTQKLDSFARPDGLAPAAANQPLRMPARDEPVVISKKPPKKKSFFGRFRRDKAGLDGMGRRKTVSRKKKFLRGFGIFLLIIFLVGGFLFAKGYLNLKKVLSGNGGAAALQQDVDPSKLRGEGDGRVNILILGRGGEGHEGADLTDTLILASIDPVAKEAALVSIPRDLYVPVTGKGSMKINSVFYTGKSASLNKSSNKSSKKSAQNKKQAEDAGFKLIEQTVEKTLGVPVHYHAMVDFAGFKQAVDTVGGIDVNVTTKVREKMRIEGRNYILDVKPGRQHMDGFKALAYSRSRQTSARGDFDRSERQRQIILALKDKTLSAGTFSNPSKISGLLDNFGNHVQTNFAVQDLSRLYELSKQLGSNKISSIGLADPPNNYVVTKNIGGLSVVVPRAGKSNFREVQTYIRNNLKDSFLKNENASVVILNGTNVPGVAGAKAEELKSFGYNVARVDNEPAQNYSKTVIVDLRSGSKKYTKNYLQKRFGVSTVSSIPDPAIQPGTADFVIIIGSDQARR